LANAVGVIIAASVLPESYCCQGLMSFFDSSSARFFRSTRLVCSLIHHHDTFTASKILRLSLKLLHASEAPRNIASSNRQIFQGLKTFIMSK